MSFGDLHADVLGRQAPFRRIAMVWRRAEEDNRVVAEVVAAFKEIQASKAT